MPQAAWGLADWLDWQERLHPVRIDLGLTRVRRVALQMHLLPARTATLTIAGTNGKGSSAVLAATIYRAAGYRTGCYTSPHLLRYNERVTIDGVEASDAALCEAFAAVEAARDGVSLTYFEFGTLAALWLFRRAAVDVQVLEVGLGGRLDAVNIVDADSAIVTQIGLDHTALLGPDRQSIAREKAAVYRAGRVAVCGDPDPPDSLLHAARHADLRRIGHEFGWRCDGADQEPLQARVWEWCGRGQHYSALPLPHLPGTAQLRNAAGVLAAIEALAGLRPVSSDAIEAGLRSFHLPGRLERRGDLLLDVGHNAEAVEALAQHLERLSEAPRALVIGMMRDKPVEAVGRRLAPLFQTVCAVGLAPPRGLSAQELASRLQGAGMRPREYPDVAAALAEVRRRTTGNGPIVVCGSFRTVAAAAGR